MNENTIDTTAQAMSTEEKLKLLLDVLFSGISFTLTGGTFSLSTLPYAKKESLLTAKASLTLAKLEQNLLVSQGLQPKDKKETEDKLKVITIILEEKEKREIAKRKKQEDMERRKSLTDALLEKRRKAINEMSEEDILKELEKLNKF